MNPLICTTTYNEEDSIAVLVGAFVRLGYSVLVVDGGSTDNTLTVALQAGAITQSSTQRRAIGPCLMRGWKIALDRGFDGVLHIDAGRSHCPDDARQILGAAEHIPADVVIGSRFLPGARYDNIRGPLLRPVATRFAAWMMNYAQDGANWSDWTSGYRYFNRRALELLLKRTYLTGMHTWQIEVLAYAGEMGLKIVEEPIWYTAGRSSFSWTMARDAFRVWRHVLQDVGWVRSRLHEEIA